MGEPQTECAVARSEGASSPCEATNLINGDTNNRRAGDEEPANHPWPIGWQEAHITRHKRLFADLAIYQLI
jgi:hypothetical protein